MVAMIGLGLLLFRLIAGGEGESLLGVVSQVWEDEIALRKQIP